MKAEDAPTSRRFSGHCVNRPQAGFSAGSRRGSSANGDRQARASVCRLGPNRSDGSLEGISRRGERGVEQMADRIARAVARPGRRFIIDARCPKTSSISCQAFPRTGRAPILCRPLGRGADQRPGSGSSSMRRTYLTARRACRPTAGSPGWRRPLNLFIDRSTFSWSNACAGRYQGPRLDRCLSILTVRPSTRRVIVIATPVSLHRYGLSDEHRGRTIRHRRAGGDVPNSCRARPFLSRSSSSSGGKGPIRALRITVRCRARSRRSTGRCRCPRRLSRRPCWTK